MSRLSVRLQRLKQKNDAPVNLSNLPSQYMSDSSNLDRASKAFDNEEAKMQTDIKVIGPPPLQKNVSQVPEVDEKLENSDPNISSRASLPSQVRSENRAIHSARIHNNSTREEQKGVEPHESEADYSLLESDCNSSAMLESAFLN